MTEFSRIATVLSIVLGLGMTRLLLGVVTVFRIRRESPVDWVPLVWACVLFAVQLQYWWVITQLPAFKTTFSFPEFVFLVLLTLMLFLSAALLLPSRSEDEGEGVRVYFEKAGRYGLLALAAFLLMGFAVNVFFFQSSPLSTWGVSDVPMIVLPIAAFLASHRKTYVALTLIYVPMAAFDFWVS